MKSYKFLDAFWLKLIMIILMVLDHLYYNLFPDNLLWAHYAARVVAPVFVYLMTEGMMFSRNRNRYILRMYGFGLFMMAGNLFLYALYGVWIENSIILSLALGGSAILLKEKARESDGIRKLWFTAGFILIFCVSVMKINGYYIFEGSYMIPLMAVIFYYLRKKPVIMWGIYSLVFCLPILLLGMSTGYIQPQFYMIMAVIPISIYNHKRGYNSVFSKYFFYIFYPVHIWIIYLLERSLL